MDPCCNFPEDNNQPNKTGCETAERQLDRQSKGSENIMVEGEKKDEEKKKKKDPNQKIIIFHLTYKQPPNHTNLTCR